MSYVDGINGSMVLFNISCKEVAQIISTLNNSSAGCDEIPTFVAKQCIPGFIEPLTYLINLSYTEGCFPSGLKLARVVPILKLGDSSQVNNYRPISILTFFSKIFEKIMYNHVLDFLDDNSILYERQFGFRKNIQLYRQSSLLSIELLIP